MSIDVPDFDEKAAYDHDRPISGLIRTQLLHLHQAENLSLPPGRRTGININDLQTERQASEYIQKATVLLHRHGKAQAAKAAAKRPRKTKKVGPKVRAVATKKAAKRRKKPIAKARTGRPAAKRRKSRK